MDLIPYDEWRSDAVDPAFSEWLRALSEPEWAAVVAHPFAASISRGDVADDDMRRYLLQDFQFVDSFTALLGAAVASADSFESRVPFGRFLGETATTEEKTYFHRALAALGVTPAELAAPRTEPVTAEFRALMDEARTSLDYPLILAVLCVAEWSYLGWASLAEEPLPDTFVHREWIDLHEGPVFRAWVGFLRGELDRLGPRLGEEEQLRVLGFFRRAVRLELRFFDMAAGA
ncbi:TenA family protein [Streptosporangium sp. NBC_01639]|uniref:TenA family protein n=1 Tax=unclassified Streptosporangium TaxID=2632669 RepID=UPI002DDA45F7|nr:TenA family protein [Streptosporangium sp. NBC_01756]WSC87506.1 TenA family protein [Streptosporangium sp. NBC_01756]WTD53816.1 TenA family protein [Streptosporangium sp. NBC_01639]